MAVFDRRYFSGGPKRDGPTTGMRGNKVIFLLMGAKGSGKSFIGALMERNFGIRFLRVEEWVLKLRRNAAVDDPAYVDLVFETIERGVRAAMLENDAVVFESTGLSDAFERMWRSLKRDHRVVTIGVDTDPALCLQRVRTRDQRIHINVSDADVTRINQAVLALARSTDHSIMNTARSAEKVLKDLQLIVAPYLTGPGA